MAKLVRLDASPEAIARALSSGRQKPRLLSAFLQGLGPTCARRYPHGAAVLYTARGRELSHSSRTPDLLVGRWRTGDAGRGLLWSRSVRASQPGGLRRVSPLFVVIGAALVGSCGQGVPDDVDGIWQWFPVPGSSIVLTLTQRDTRPLLGNRPRCQSHVWNRNVQRGADGGSHVHQTLAQGARPWPSRCIQVPTWR